MSGTSYERHIDKVRSLVRICGRKWGYMVVYGGIWGYMGAYGSVGSALECRARLSSVMRNSIVMNGFIQHNQADLLLSGAGEPAGILCEHPRTGHGDASSHMSSHLFSYILIYARETNDTRPRASRKPHRLIYPHLSPHVLIYSHIRSRNKRYTPPRNAPQIPHISPWVITPKV